MGSSAPAFILILICAFLMFFMLQKFQSRTDDTVSSISKAYLSELSSQTVGHLKTSLDSQFAKIVTTVDSINEADLKDLNSLQRFLKKQMKNNRFSYVAVLDSDGMCYTPDDVYSAISKINSLDTLLSGKGRLISSNETILGDDMILLGTPVSDIKFRGKQITAVLVGMDTHILSEKLVLHKDNTNSYADVISKKGAFVMRSAKGA